MTTLSRRELLTAAAGAALLAGCSPGTTSTMHPTSANSPALPQVDFHCHPDELGVARINEVSKTKGIKFGVVEHAGSKVHTYPKYPVILSSDAELNAYLKLLDGHGVYKGIQAEGLDWMRFFSKDAVAQLDYVLTDALTLPGGPPQANGYVYIWKAELVQIDDPRKWMDMYVDHHVNICAAGPIDILANVTFMPAALQSQYDALWTEARARKIIDALLKYGIALEISAKSKIPRLPFLQQAKAAGCKFSFGTNARSATDMGDLAWGLEMAGKLGLQAKDIFTPAPAGKKPVQVR